MIECFLPQRGTMNKREKWKKAFQWKLQRCTEQMGGVEDKKLFHFYCAKGSRIVGMGAL